MIYHTISGHFDDQCLTYLAQTEKPVWACRYELEKGQVMKTKPVQGILRIIQDELWFIKFDVNKKPSKTKAHAYHYHYADTFFECTQIYRKEIRKTQSLLMQMAADMVTDALSCNEVIFQYLSDTIQPERTTDTTCIRCWKTKTAYYADLYYAKEQPKTEPSLHICAIIDENTGLKDSHLTLEDMADLRLIKYGTVNDRAMDSIIQKAKQAAEILNIPVYLCDAPNTTNL